MRRRIGWWTVRPAFVLRRCRVSRPLPSQRDPVATAAHGAGQTRGGGDGQAPGHAAVPHGDGRSRISARGPARPTWTGARGPDHMDPAARHRQSVGPPWLTTGRLPTSVALRVARLRLGLASFCVPALLSPGAAGGATTRSTSAGVRRADGQTGIESRRSKSGWRCRPPRGRARWPTGDARRPVHAGGHYVPALETIDRLLSLPAARTLSPRRGVPPSSAEPCRAGWRTGERQAALGPLHANCWRDEAEIESAALRARLHLHAARSALGLGRIAETAADAERALGAGRGCGDLALIGASR